jgi:N-glycosylase/DNA lyase
MLSSKFPLWTQSDIDSFLAIRPTIIQRLQEFADIPSDEYFYELCFCLCTPQSKARNAEQVIEKLRRENFQEQCFNPVAILRDKQHYIRFHNVKAQRLMEMQQQYSKLHTTLIADIPTREKRTLLVERVKGFGWKEASHFLRNIGGRGITILDRHVLKNLVRFGVCTEEPKVGSKKAYLHAEQLFEEFAAAINIDIDELDHYFWYLQTGEVFK